MRICITCKSHGTRGDSQLLDKGGLRVREEDTIDSAHRTSRMEEVDTKVDIFSFFTLTDVLHSMSHERHMSIT